MPVIILFTILFSLFASFGWATEVDHLTLEEIVVTDSISSEPAATVVGKETIERGKNVNIPDVLKNEPDIDLHRRASIGDTADILSIRGLSGDRILLNIDGRPVNAAGVVGGYFIDWGTIPLDNIERIEIIKGGSSAIYGNNALGGVINVVTQRPTETPTLTFYGNYGIGQDGEGIQNYRLTHTYKIGPLGYSLAASYQKGDPFLWNNDFEAKNFAGSLYLDMPLRGELSLGLQYNNTVRGFIRENRLSDDPTNPNFFVKKNPNYPLAFGETLSPYMGNVSTPGPDAQWDKTKYYLDLGYKQPIGDALVEFKVYKNIEDRREKNYSSSSVVSGYPDGILVLDRTVESDRSYGGNLKGTIPLGKHELIMGVDYKVLAFGNTIVNYVDTTYNGQPYSGYAPSQEGKNWGYYAQDTWKMSDWFTATLGLRYDIYHLIPINGSTIPELNDDGFSPKLTGTFKITPSDTLTASVYQALRTPNLPEMYWWATGQTHGNPVLQPEKNTAGELIYQHNFGKKSSVRLSTYYYNIDNFIYMRFDPNWQGTYNIDKVTLWGGSVEGRTDITGWLSAKANLTYQKSKKEGDPFDTAHLTDELDYLPEWKGSLGLDWKLPYKMLLNTTARYVGEQKTIYTYSTGWGWPQTTNYKLMTLDSFITADVELKIPLMKHVELSLYVENLFDKQYQEVLGYPSLGRVIGTAIKLTF